ncbi:TPA: hypothetical protein OL524_001704 [Clostridioides difficile]|nr:hypothetical protein [Clostridioides difficile]
MNKFKNVIFKTLFPEEYNVYKGKISTIGEFTYNGQQVVDKMDKDIKSLKVEIDEMKKCFDKISEIGKLNYTIVAVEENKKHEFVIVAKRILDSSCYIYLFNNGIEIEPITIISAAIYQDNKAEPISVEINDITVQYLNVNNASIAMNHFILIAKKEIKAKKITGNISIVDKDHWDRIIHFYSKFNFEINYSGHIPTSINLIFNEEK